MLGEPMATALSTHFLLKAMACSRSRAIQRVGTMLAVYRYVHYRRPRSFHGRAKLLQIFRVGRSEVSGPGLDLVDLKLLDDVGGEVFQFHWLGGFAVRSSDEFPKRIRGDGNTFPRLRRKIQIRSGAGVGQTGPSHTPAAAVADCSRNRLRVVSKLVSLARASLLVNVQHAGESPASTRSRHLLLRL